MPWNSAESQEKSDLPQSFNAKNAFQPKQNQEVEEAESESSIVSHVNNSILKNINVEEIQKYAQQLGTNTLSDNDLKYGLMFGRSVLVNVQAWKFKKQGIEDD